MTIGLERMVNGVRYENEDVAVKRIRVESLVCSDWLHRGNGLALIGSLPRNATQHIIHASDYDLV